ncbi:MAG TPA: DNA repair protein RadA [Candidatus Limisoma gallistercoris]|nr:DNA repair protein RadA [Candidatus Limisoma gallistercoris]
MAKTKTVYFCSNCGNESPKWLGKCPNCGEWNTYVEEKVQAPAGKGTLLSHTATDSVPVKLAEINQEKEERIQMPSGELNRVLGGGLVAGSIILIGGEPGIGKSTLVLQNMLRIRSRKVLYVSGEESARQLKMRADRLGADGGECYIVCETSLEKIFRHIENCKPGILVVDSIQTVASDALESSAGSVSQVRECAAALLKYAKESGTPVILIGHINKEGSIAGPKVLEHIVDAVLQFEGDRHYMYRLLRSIKNRFGSTSELGIYEMTQVGLREVSNPSELLLSESDEALSGVAIGVTLEGARPFLIEAQALVSTAAYGTPQRSVTGFDSKRMNMLLAVLEKRVGFKLAQKDVFLNIAGGLKVNDPALDLAVICAILSSNVDMPVAKGVCMSGEVGLSGEIRPITRIEQRIIEADKLGFSTIYIPKNNLKGIGTSRFGIRIVEVAKVEEVFRGLFA